MNILQLLIFAIILSQSQSLIYIWYRTVLNTFPKGKQITWYQILQASQQCKLAGYQLAGRVIQFFYHLIGIVAIIHNVCCAVGV